MNPKKPTIKLELLFCLGNYRITKIAHSSRVQIPGGRFMRVGDQTRDETLIDHLASEFDITITES